MARNLDQTKKDNVRELYLSGRSYSDIHKLTGHAMSTIAGCVKGLRSHADSVKLAKLQGKGNLSEEGREKLSKAGQNACLQNRKFWTKPEQQFCTLIRGMGLGISFPVCLLDIIQETSDANANIMFQYPIQRYVCDFVDVSKKVVFRIQGDFWHANPILYDENSFCDIQKHNVKQDQNCKIFLEKHGWLVCDIWESELKWNIVFVEEKIRAARKMANPFALHAKDSRFESEAAHCNDWSERLHHLWFAKKKKIVDISSVTKLCPTCGKEFVSTKQGIRSQKRCSRKCFNQSRRTVVRPPQDVILKDVQELGFLGTGRKYGVSDNAIRKWLKNTSE